MCWSWPVSLSFVLFQFICLSYTTYRNKYIDRWYALICLPFFGQEFCQFIEWAFGDIENVTDDNISECNLINKIFAKILIMDAFLIPLFISLFAYKTSSNNNKWLKLVWKYWFYFELTTYFIVVPAMMFDDECVNVGPNGHQQWPPLFTAALFTKYLGPIPTLMITSIYYFPSIFMVGIFYRPLWVSILPAIYGAVSLIVAFIIIGEEAWSVWCWSCAWIALWTVLYVPCTNIIIQNWRHKDLAHSITDNAMGHNLFTQILFKNMHQHLARFDMLTDEEKQKMVKMGKQINYSSVPQNEDQDLTSQDL